MRSVSIAFLFSCSLCFSLAFAATEAKSPIPDSDALSLKRDELIQVRMKNQGDRIEAGRKNGELDSKSVKALRKQLARVRKMEKKAVTDGKISPEEMKNMELALDELSDQIGKKAQNEHSVQ
jgi:hypothetical protein